MTASPEAWVSVAHLLRPQGRHGELLAELLTDFPESLRSRAELLLLAAPRAVPRPITVLSHWFPSGRNEGRIVLKFDGVDSIDQAKQLAGADLVIPSGSRAPLPSGSFYISDLVGLAVFNHGALLGHVKDISFPLSPDGRRRLPDAAPLLLVATQDGQELDIPFVEAYLGRIDLAAGTIAMSLPDGMADLNAGESP